MPGLTDLIPLAVSAYGALSNNGAADRRLASTYAGDANSALRNQGAVANQLGTFAQGDTAAYNQFAPQARAATQGEADYLRQNPYTDNFSTQALNRATSGVTSAYLRSRANLSSDLARRGMGGDSSALTGGLAAMDASRAGIIGNAGEELAYRKIADNGGRLAQLAQLLSGAGQSAQQGAEGALTPQASIYGNMGSAYDVMAQQARQRASAAGAAQAGAFGNIGNLASALFSGGGNASGGGADYSSGATNMPPGMSYTGLALPRLAPTYPGSGG